MTSTPATTDPFEIFLATAPGLETALADEALSCGFKNPKAVPGGVTFMGRWEHVWRANLHLRGATRVTAALGSFPAQHLSDLDKRARRFPWGEVLRKDVPFRVEALCSKSKIYHSGAAAERIANAISATLGARLDAAAPVLLRARIERDVCHLSVDTSGELLHKRGYKQGVGKAPMRETMAALFLRQCGYTGTEPVCDPLCGSGTFVIEAAEIAAGLKPGRARRFAFEELATFKAASWQALRDAPTLPMSDSARFFGSDRDPGAIRMSCENAARAGVADRTQFVECDIADIARPDGPPGLVILNPPYGDRIGDAAKLAKFYRSIGSTLMKRFSGWRVGIVTNDADLAGAMRLPFLPTGPFVSHGGLRVTLHRTAALP